MITRSYMVYSPYGEYTIMYVTRSTRLNSTPDTFWTATNSLLPYNYLYVLIHTLCIVTSELSALFSLSPSPSPVSGIL